MRNGRYGLTQYNVGCQPSTWLHLPAHAASLTGNSLTLRAETENDFKAMFIPGELRLVRALWKHYLPFFSPSHYGHFGSRWFPATQIGLTLSLASPPRFPLASGSL